MPSSIKAKKSKNFDKNLNGSRQVKQMEKNMVFVGEDFKVKSKKFIPIETRQTMMSLKGKKKGNSYVLSSINWKGSYGDRYNYKTSKVRKNKNKYKWFSRAYEENEKKYKEYMKRSVYVK